MRFYPRPRPVLAYIGGIDFIVAKLGTRATLRAGDQPERLGLGLDHGALNGWVKVGLDPFSNECVQRRNRQAVQLGFSVRV
jgi:hypothetical protein